MRITDWLATCDKNCEPDCDVHSEECIKSTHRISNCRYCCDGDDCLICGRLGKQVEDGKKESNDVHKQTAEKR